MTDIGDQGHEDRAASEARPESEDRSGATESRRRILKLGALAVPAVATLSPNMAMATYGGGGGGGGNPPVGGASVSLMACTVPMPEYIDEEGFPVDEREKVQKNGKLYHKSRDGKWVRVYKGPPEGSYSGEQLKNSISRGNWNPPNGVQPDEFEAHVQYLYKVRYQQVNGAGLTCLISLTSNLDAYHA